MSDYDLTYLSYGAGVQSTALLVCSALGLYGVPRVDLAVIADTGDEPQYVYGYLQIITAWAAGHNIPVKVVSKGVLSDALLHGSSRGKRAISIPLFTQSPDGGNTGMLMRQCTTEYKVQPIARFIRTHMGVEDGRRVRQRVRALLGISIDEAHRMKPSRHRWIHNTWPLVDAELDRRKCERIVVEAGLPKPHKSSCVFCPYHSDHYWSTMKRDQPQEFAKAVAFDREIRAPRGNRSMLAFVHRSCRPLEEVDFDPQRDQVDMFGNECEGMCGV